MNQNSLILNTSLLVSLLLLVGCGDQGGSRIPPRYMVSGTVTLDGEPLKSGSIRFSSPEDASLGISSGGDVVDGNYEFMAIPGKKSVKISCMKEVKKHVFQNLIPPKYNLKSTLTAEVIEETQQIDFKLKSK